MSRSRCGGVTAILVGAAVLAILAGGCGRETASSTSSSSERWCREGDASPACADEVYGTFADLQAEGRGETVIDLPDDIGDARAGVVRMTYEGDAPLVVWSLDEEHVEQMILIDATIGLVASDPGEFDGETMWWPANDPPRALRVEGDGSWELSVLPVSAAPPLESEGRGIRVYLYDGPGGVVSGHKPNTEVGMSLTQFRLTTDGGTPKELVTERTRTADFRARLDPGPSVLIVGHRGPWTLELPIEEW